MLRHTIVYLILLFYCGVFAQELPPIENYTPKIYNGEYQNWGISQSDSKIIYIANHSNLLEFDGSKWRSYKLPSASIIRSVEVVEDRIYTGSYREFGYWTKEQNNQLSYTSLSDYLESPVSDDEEFWDILAMDHWVLFQSLDRIYIYDLLTHTFKILDASSAKAKLQRLGGKVYFQKAGLGLFTIENGKAVLVSDHTVLRSQSLIGLYEYQGELLLITNQGNWYLYDFKSLRPFFTDMDALDLRIYSSIRLDDGSFVLGSISNGFYHLDKGGNLIRHVNQAKGLNNNTVLSLFEDADHNLWLGLDNGISVVNLNSPFSEYIDKLGKLGVVYAALKHQGYMYLGTNQGLFYRNIDGAEDFKLIRGTEGQVWSLQIVHRTIFCGHNSGTFVINGSQAELVSDYRGTWGVKPIGERADLVLQGNYNGLSVLQNTNGHWSLRNIIKGFNTSSRFFEINNLDVVVNHEKKGLFYLHLDPELQKTLKVENVPAISHSSNLFEFDSQLYYKTFTGIYSIGHKLTDIKLDSAMTRLIFKEDEKPISIIIPDPIQKRLWYFTENGIKYISKSSLSGKLDDFNVPIPNSLSNNLGVSGFENISRVDKDKYLIGSSNGYISLDLSKVSPSSSRIDIRQVQYGDYQNVSTLAKPDIEGSFKYIHNNVKFQYSVPEFDKYTDLKYQYKLEGQYDQWSPWSQKAEVSFMNLPFGDYNFSVRAMAGNKLSENTASYSFNIARPWYFSYLALILYFLGFILLCFLIHRIYRRYYRNKQQALIETNQKELERRNLMEKERISQILNEKLQSEIENKNRELAISTMSILNKNKFLSYLKSQLSLIPDKDKRVKHVLSEIDDNINSEDDWKFFEDAFNNADKDFLNRIKAKHSGLNHNDLRLCAYLRLNLTTKEIAPLLNISVKSAEMKRYRLRKKLGLDHLDNLTDYILDF